MAQLYDELMRNMPHSSPWRMALEDCTVFDVQNVADYVFENMWMRNKSYSALDLPALTPPFARTFFEYVTPSFVNRDDDLPRQTRVGVCMHAEDHDPSEAIKDNLGTPHIGVRWIIRSIVYMPQGFTQSMWPMVGQIAQRCERPNEAHAELSAIRRTGLLGGNVMYLDSEGGYMTDYESRQLDTLTGWLLCHAIPPTTVIDAYKKETGDPAWSAVYNQWERLIMPLLTWHGELRGRMSAPVFVGIGLLHCKNVTVTEQRPPDWQQKAAMKKHKRPLVTYRVLNIEPMKTVLRTEGDIEHNGLKKALHICRGHFKTFTADKPLFGKVAGTYWWSSQVRGSAEVGVALKDYNVRAPRQTPK